MSITLQKRIAKEVLVTVGVLGAALALSFPGLLLGGLYVSRFLGIILFGVLYVFPILFIGTLLIRLVW